MNGGYQILDLRKINIQIDDEEVAITDEDVLTQLLNLSEFLDIQTGLLSKQLKPIYILMNKSAGYGEINLVSEGVFLIQADFNNAKLSLLITISVDNDDDGNPYFVVDSAEYTYKEVTSSPFYNYDINVEELEMESGVKKTFTRDELPTSLKSFFDLLHPDGAGQIINPIYVHVVDENFVYGEGFLIRSGDFFELTIDDGKILYLEASSESNLAMTYYEL